MRVHLISRSTWFEPHRLRQQLAILLAQKYDVVYHQPFPVEREDVSLGGGGDITIKRYRLIWRFGSTPIICFINYILIRAHFFLSLKKGDVLINFLPEMISRPRCRTLISVVNDDLSSMQRKLMRAWYKWLMHRMCSISDVSFFVSTVLKNKFGTKDSKLLYPWADRQLMKYSGMGGKDVILYWGYIHEVLDFDAVESILEEIKAKKLGMRFLMVGPVSSGVLRRLDKLKRYSFFELLPACELDKLDLDKVAFGVELINPAHLNAVNVEFPNKAPRLLSYGIPLVYSGVNLIDKPFFIRYERSLEDLLGRISASEGLIGSAIDEYFMTDNSASILQKIVNVLESR